MRTLVPPFPFLVVLAACALALATGLTAQFGFHLRPCILCLYQRVPYILSGLLALVALIPLLSYARRTILLLIALAFMVNAGIASFHVGVEQHWWGGLAACEGEAQPLPGTPEALMAALKGPPPPRCDEIPFQVMGVSMAGANVPASLILAVFSALAARRKRNAR